MRRGKLGPWLRFAVLVLKPLMTALTRRDWHGMEHVPRSGGVVLCTNHLSHADPLTFAHFVWDTGRIPRFLAKDVLFGLPVLGRLLRGAGQIPVARESKDAGQAYLAAVQAVERGEAVCIYPEATLTRDPALWPMAGKTGAARVALATGVPVVPVAQWGAQDILAPYSRRLRLWPRATIHVAAGPPVPLEDLRAAEPTAQVLTAATDRILDAITALLADIRAEPAPATRLDPRASGLPRIGNPARPRRGSRP